MGKSLSNKYGEILLDSAKKSTTDAIKTASERAIKETAEATGDLIGNKITDKITSVSKKKSNNNNDNKNNNSSSNNNEDVELTPHKKRYISTEERQQIINELRLVFLFFFYLGFLSRTFTNHRTAGVMDLSLLPLFQFRKSWLMKILTREASNLNYILKTTIMMKTLMTNITIPFSSYVIFANH